MNILGVGGTELLIVLLVMLIVAGPRRMIHWSYLLGQQLAKFRRMWAETVDIVQQEFDEAGVGIQLPKEMPTRGSLNKQAAKALGSVTAPVQQTMDQVQGEMGSIQNATGETARATTRTVRGANGKQAAARPNAKSHTPAKRTGPAPRLEALRPARARPAVKTGYGSWAGHEEARVGVWSRKPEQAAPAENEG